jgi:LuxR family transcriptional regulator
LRWTAAGKTSSEVGTILGISARTVNYHIASILLKLEAVNKTQAVVKAVMLNLLN